MMTPPALIIFDCDGVLVDSEPIANQILRDALAAAGLPMTQTEIHYHFVGRSMNSVVHRAEELLGAPLPDGFLDQVQRATFAAFREALQPIPGVREVIRAIRRARIPICVASSGAIEKIRLTLGLTGLIEYFEGNLFSATDVPHGKPAPDLFLTAAQAFDIAPAKTAVIEDSRPGITAGLAAGMNVYGYTAGNNEANLDLPDVTLFEKMVDLPRLLAL